MRQTSNAAALAAVVATAFLLGGILTTPVSAQEAAPAAPQVGDQSSDQNGDQAGEKAAKPTPAAPDTLAQPTIDVSKPKSPQDRESMLAELYQHLAHAQDAEQAAPIAKTIEGLWSYTDSPTIALLMNRAYKAVNAKNPELALKLLDAVTDLAPDYAEGWSRRAYVYYTQNDTEHAVGDLRRALALEPNHYKALEGLARILSESGQKKSALKAYQELLRINPFMPGAKEAADALSLEVEGQGI